MPEHEVLIVAVDGAEPPRAQFAGQPVGRLEVSANGLVRVPGESRDDFILRALGH